MKMHAGNFVKPSKNTIDYRHGGADRNTYAVADRCTQLPNVSLEPVPNMHIPENVPGWMKPLAYLTAAVVMSAASAGCITTRKDSSLTGYITNVKDKGVFWTTPEITVRLDPFLVPGETFKEEQDYEYEGFCLDDLSKKARGLKEVARRYMLSGERVEIMYTKEMFVSPRRCGPNLIAEAIMPAPARNR